MPKSHRLYPAEFRQRIIEPVRKGRTPKELGRHFEPAAPAIRNWLKQAGLDAGERTDGLTTGGNCAGSAATSARSAQSEEGSRLERPPVAVAPSVAPSP